jgi:hypothetical protein
MVTLYGASTLTSVAPSGRMIFKVMSLTQTSSNGTKKLNFRL